jgi:hypothetical protein
MSKPKDPKDPNPSNRPDEPTAVGSQGSDKRSGRVTHDSRGNPVWEWQLETGVYSRDMTTQKLRKLDLGDLSIADTGLYKRPGGLELERDRDKDQAPMPGGGFNPYDNAAPGKKDPSGGFNPYDNARALGNKIRPPQPPPAPERKPTNLKKLNDWIKLKKRVQDSNDD